MAAYKSLDPIALRITRDRGRRALSNRAGRAEDGHSSGPIARGRRHRFMSTASLPRPTSRTPATTTRTATRPSILGRADRHGPGSAVPLSFTPALTWPPIPLDVADLVHDRKARTDCRKMDRVAEIEGVAHGGARDRRPCHAPNKPDQVLPGLIRGASFGAASRAANKIGADIGGPDAGTIQITVSRPWAG